MNKFVVKECQILPEKDISILKQFKYVDLKANPVLNTKDIKLIENILLNN